MTYQITKNHNKIRITFKEGRNRWFAEMTRKDYKEGLSWVQWGASEQYLRKSMKIVEKEVANWINEYCC